tara:strand:+ start:448 stop:2475 length:2028 start_codon:yes stop_codon:yes gene_type:complete
MWNLLLTYLTLSVNITSYFHEYNAGKYEGAENVTIDYIQNYPVFSTSYNESHIIKTVRGQENCELECNQLSNCTGYTYFNQNNSCNLLNDTGTNLYTTDTEVSFEKVVFYNSFSAHTLSGFVYYPENARANTTVYLDINHNGILDTNEPRQVVENRKHFTFRDLEEGMYLIRQIIPEMCHELYPGIYGITSSFSGQGFFDYVRYFYPYQSIYGGIIGDSSFDRNNAELSFITGNDQSIYLSFYDNYSIVLGMSDDIIVNGPGSDIFFNIYGNTSLLGNVSVSREGREFTYVGVLSDNVTEFDINETTPVKFVKIDFFSTSLDDRPRNIISIRSQGRVYYDPPFSYYVSAGERNLIFINDCSYYYRCSTFCDFHVNAYFYRNSCKYGCTVYQDTKTCDCVYSEASNYLYSEFNQTECEMGCNYAMNKHFFPDYAVFDNSHGYIGDMLEGYINLNRSLEICNTTQECQSVTMGENGEFFTQDSMERFYSQGSYFFVKRSLMTSMNLPYFTTTQTSTVTSSPTSTMTSTATSTVTSSPTSTMTSSPTSTITSTATSTVTSSPTSTITSTATSTITSSPTSTMTSTIMLDTTGFRSEYIAILVIAGFILIICIPIAYTYYKVKKSERSVGSMTPRYAPHYSNPVYQAAHDITEEYKMESTRSEGSADYMDVFEEDDRTS